MDASLDAPHGTSEELYDPYCDSCFEDGGQNVRAFGFCKECVQCLCKVCHRVHGRLQSSRNHIVVYNEDMPKSQGYKPPRFDPCDVHPKLLKDQFCGDHKILLCSVCSSSEHNTCFINNVEEVCTIVDTSDTGALYDRIRSLRKTLQSTLSAIDKAMMELKDQEKTMLHDAQKVYDQVIAQAYKLHGSIKNEIQASCQLQTSVLSGQRKKVSDTILKLYSPLIIVAAYKAESIDTNVFLRLQEIVTFTKKIAYELQELRKSQTFVSLSFIQSQSVQAILSASFTLGKIQKSESLPHGTDISVEDIVFPVSALKQMTAQPDAGHTQGPQSLGGAVGKPQFAQQNQPLKDIKASKNNTHKIKLKDDMRRCYITGMAITNDKRILIADKYNDRVKFFSHDMRFLSFVETPKGPRDIAMISEREAVVTTDPYELVTLDISGSHLSIKTTTQLSYNVWGISRYKNKLVVTSPCCSAPLKVIDQTGKVYWSLLPEQQGQSLFRLPLYVVSPGDVRSSTVIVTDQSNHTLTLLNGDTGEVINRRQLKERKEPKGITTDSAGNVYVCYSGTSEVVVLSGDLSEEKILLSRQDGLNDSPEAIMYDGTTHQLTVSYFSPILLGYNKVDQFMLS